MKLAAILIVLAGLIQAQSQPPTQAASQPQAGTPKPEVEALPASTVVAVIDGKEVTAGDVRDALIQMPPEFVKLYNQNPVYALQQMFMMRYLAAEAEKKNLHEQSPIKEQLALARANFLASAMLTNEQNSYSPPRKDVEDYYKQNLSNFQQARVKVITVGFRSAVFATPKGTPEEQARAMMEMMKNGPQRNEEEARTRASEAAQRAKSGEDFDKLIAEYSDPVPAPADGKPATDPHIAVVNQGSAHSPELKKAVLTLNAGESTDPIRTDAAFVVMRVEEKSIQPLSEVDTSIYQELRAAHLREWLEVIGARFNVQIRSSEFFMQPKQAASGPTK
jgi:parvulin-like peptidyl-prolyl isomerase